MKRILTTAAFAWTLAALVLPARAGATETAQFHFRDRAASAVFFTDDGCVIGGVYVLEALSVILQVGSFKLRGKRIFKMAPLHHHVEALGWKEAKIITRFWIAGLVMALFALTTLKLR